MEDVDAFVTVLEAESCNLLDRSDHSEHGRFAWVIDPEGNKVELWQPPRRSMRPQGVARKREQEP